MELVHQYGGILGASLTSTLLETQCQVGYFMCTNRAGDAFERVRGTFDCRRVSRVRGDLQHVEPILGLGEETSENTSDRIRRPRRLQAAQLEQ